MSTDDTWKDWGQRDPYYGVLSDERFSRDQIDANWDEFFSLGVRDVDAAITRCERTFGALPKRSALDFGCGVGRLTLALASKFERVVGVDVSPAMLAEAARNADRLDRKNVTFASSDDDLSAATGMFDWVNSYIVLQHIPPDRGLPIIRQLLKRVAPGGGCLIHVSVQRPTSLVKRVAYWTRFHVPFGTKLVNLIKNEDVHRRSMQMNEYPLPVILREFQDAGMSEFVAVSEDHGGVLTLSLISRRPH